MSNPEHEPAWSPPSGQQDPPAPPDYQPPQPASAPTALPPGQAAYPPSSAPPAHPPQDQLPVDASPTAYPGSTPPAYPGSAPPAYGPAPYAGAPTPPPWGGTQPTELTAPGPIPLPAPPPRRGVGGRIGRVAGALLLVIIIVVVKAVTGGLGTSGPKAPSNPFDQTAAASYPVAEAGIEMPAPTAVPGFTADAVSAALQNVRAALIAGRLDQKMLYQHDLSTLKPLMSTYGQSQLDNLASQQLLGVVATQIADGYKLTEDGIRVKGQTTFDGGLLDGVKVLTVHTNYVWIYPFTGTLSRPGDHLVTIHDKIDWIFPAKDEVVPDYVGMDIGDNSEYTANNIDCGLLKKDLIALGQPVQTSANVGSPDNAFDPNGSMDVPETVAC
jgi:hypothetical protein